MQNLCQLSVAKIIRDPDQPRKLFDEGPLLALGQNMLAIGQQVPLIVFPAGELSPDGLFMLADGERRWRGMQLVGISDASALVLPERPLVARLRILQMSLEAHKAAMTPLERSNLLAAIRQETGWGIGELADNLQLSQSLATKLLAVQRLDKAIQNLVHSGALDLERAYICSQETDQARQVELAKESAGLSREQLRAKVKQKTSAAKPKAKRAVFVLPTGMSFTVAGSEASLEDVIEGLMAVVKELKRGLAQGLDVTTAQRVMADKAKVVSR